MTATNDQIVAEASRRAIERGWGAPPVEHFIIEVVREGWTPPEPKPEPVDPDVLAWREWAARRSEANGSTDWASAYRQGRLDHTDKAQAYLAGARMAREQERERARKLAEFVEDQSRRLDGVGARAHDILAKYRGEA